MFSQSLQNMLMSNGNNHNNNSQFAFFDESRIDNTNINTTTTTTNNNKNNNNNLLSQVGIHPSAVNGMWLSNLNDTTKITQQIPMQHNYDYDYDSEDRKASLASISSYDSLCNDRLFDIGTSIINNDESNGITPIDTNSTSPDITQTDYITREMNETEGIVKLEDIQQFKTTTFPDVIINNKNTDAITATTTTTNTTTNTNTNPNNKTNPKKRRKSSASSTISTVSSSSSPSSRVKKPMTLTQRKAHNKIERKYRININSKIANLQKLVPWMSKENIAFEVESQSGGEYVPNENDRGKKLNKSMILDIVTDYLSHLKEENRRQLKEIEHLKSQMK